jgi:hypothetical protein
VDVNEQDDAMILDQPWPPDLHPSWVPFRRRTLTVMERAGLFNNPAAIDNLTEDDILSWENAGVGTLRDFIEAGNAGIVFHHGPARDLAPVANQPWAQHVSRRDPRFTDLLPKTDETVAQIAVEGHQDHQRALLANLEAIRRRVDEIAAQTPEETLREWMGLITGQAGRRLDIVMARLGYTDEQILLREAAAELGVSYVRVRQIVAQAKRAIERDGLPPRRQISPTRSSGP